MLICPTADDVVVVEPDELIIWQCGDQLITDQLNVTWADNTNPPATRRYDLYVDVGSGFVDQGPSVQYPTNTWPTPITVPTNGQQVTKRLYFWDDPNNPPTDNNGDGLPDTNDFLECTCTAADIDNLGHVLFSEIESTADEEKCFPTNEEYVAEALYQNQGTCYFTLDVGQQCVFLDSIPDWSGPTVSVTSANELQQILSNGSSGTCYDGGGNTFTLLAGTAINTSSIQLRNMTLLAASGGAQFLKVNGTGVEFLNSTVDMGGNSFQSGIQVNGNSFSFVDSTATNQVIQGGITSELMRIRSGNNYIACSNFTDIIGQDAAVRGIRWDGYNGAGSKIYNNYFENLQSKNNLVDADAIVAQNTTFTSTTEVYANRGLNFGKRLVKLMAGNVEVLSNWGWWRDSNGPLGYRNKRAFVEHIIGNDVTIRNNFIRSDYSGSNEETIGYVISSNRTGTGEKINLDCNQYQVNHQDPGFDYGIMVFNWNGTSPDYPTNSSMLDNVTFGSGSLRSAYYDRNTPNQNNFATFANSNTGVNGVPSNQGLIRNT